MREAFSAPCHLKPVESPFRSVSYSCLLCIHALRQNGSGLQVFVTVCEADFDSRLVVFDLFGEENGTDATFDILIETEDDPQFCGKGPPTV